MICANHRDYVNSEENNQAPPPGGSVDGNLLADQHNYNDLARSVITDTNSYLHELVDEITNHSQAYYENMAGNFWPNFLD